MLGWMLQAVAHVLLIDDIRDLSGIPEEVEVSAHAALGPAISTTSESVIVEVVASFLELVT